jgi:ribosomal protein L27
MQTPIVNKGTVFPAGIVVAIKKDHVLLDTKEGVKSFTFSQIERFINVKRSLSQA